MVVRTKKWIWSKGYHGEPNSESLELIEYDLPDDLEEDEILLRAVYYSVDSYVRLFPSRDEEDVNGEQLSEVVLSKNAHFPVGTLVLSNAGWKSHYLSRGDCLRKLPFDASKVTGNNKSYSLGNFTSFICL